MNSVYSMIALCLCIGCGKAPLAVSEDGSSPADGATPIDSRSGLDRSDDGADTHRDAGLDAAQEADIALGDLYIAPYPDVTFKDPFNCPTPGPDAGMPDSGGADATAPNTCGSATAEELAATPRGNRVVEDLALSFSDPPRLTARSCVYDRLEKDLLEIWKRDPATEAVGAQLSYIPSKLVLKVDKATLAAMQDGSYAAWTCLNQRYGATMGSVIESLGLLLLEFPGVLSCPALIVDYKGLPGVENASCDHYLGGSTSCVGMSPSGELNYVFIRSASCPPTCVHVAFTHYRSDHQGTISAGSPWKAFDAEGAREVAELCGRWGAK
ncbi:MAG: hypothetical protein JRH20_27785 [Deltaproteobacteria bacterium]|nr:hypothetical protein [Deltaproteobacteria bacterium]